MIPLYDFLAIEYLINGHDPNLRPNFGVASSRILLAINAPDSSVLRLGSDRNLKSCHELLSLGLSLAALFEVGS